MIEITNNKVIITLNGTLLIQERHPGLNTVFQNEQDCFDWIVSAGWFDRYKQEAINMIKNHATQKIYQQVPVFKQANAALDIYTAEEKQAMVDIIQQYRTEVNTKEQAILAATTLEAIKSILNEYLNPLLPN